MTDVTLDSAPVIGFSLSLPMSGAWTADVQVAADAAPSAGARASLELPGAPAWVGLVKRAGMSVERAQVRLVGGTVDWQEAVQAKNYKNVSLQTVVADLGIETDQAITTQVPFWTRSSGTIGQALQQVAEFLGVNWRINPDGTVRIREEQPESVQPEHVELDRLEGRGLVIVAPEKALIVPGCTLGSDSVGDVTYDDSDGFRCRYFTESRGRLSQALSKLVRWVTRDSLYLGTYSAQVISQAADGSLDLMPHDSRIKSNGLQSVPVRHGLPGVSEVQVIPGDTVLLGFDSGSPDKPYAALFYTGSSLKIAFQTLSFEVGGVLPVAMAALVDAQLSALKAAVAAAAIVEDGAAGLGGMTALSTGLAAWPLPSGTASVILKST